MFKRRLVLPANPKQSFFLWGPRQVGKSALLRASYPDAYWVDLLMSPSYRELSQSPERLRERLRAEPAKRLVVIDEVQKVPALLDEVHYMIEREQRTFVLCGSSARKLKRGHANLLGGRALREELTGMSYAEVQHAVSLPSLLARGYLPAALSTADPEGFQEAYVNDYLREEIAAEGLVRNLPAFSRFLEVAAIGDTETLNYSNIASDVGVSNVTVQNYYQILDDTLVARRLPSLRTKLKRKTIHAPKFYFFDVGVVNFLSKRSVKPGSTEFGKAFENWVMHELWAYNAYKKRRAQLSYWKTVTGIEVDFVVGDAEFALEAKSSVRVSNQHLKGMRAFADEFPKVKAQIVVARESEDRLTDDGILILTPQSFTERLWSGVWF
jgi:uncharacterized protein